MDNFRRTLCGIDPTAGRGTIGDYEVVDLGLPSGLLWATWNVGASSETDYGNYYKYGYGTIKYQDESSNSYYKGTENPLASRVDTATNVMGSGWRMPTQTEFQDLINNTNYSWATINGIKGGKFASKTNPNAYVFFPAAGSYSYGDFISEGSGGLVWSSTPYGSSNTYYLYFNSSGRNVNCSGRRNGFSVRGVHNPI